MKRLILVLLITASLLAACFAILGTAAQTFRHDRGEADYLGQIRGEIDHEDIRLRNLQYNLAKWYNRNLRTCEPETGFEAAYGEILWYTDGVMGILQLPGQDIPIYHQGISGKISGAGHRAESAFPIGGRGNHSVLELSGEWSRPDLPEELTVGIFCLGRTMVYRSGGVYDPQREQLTLRFADGTGEILLQRTDALSIQREQPAGGISGMGKLALISAAMCCALPPFTAIFLHGVRKLHRTGKNHRKNMVKTDN